MSMRFGGPKKKTVWISVESDLYDLIASEAQSRNRTISNLLYSLISNATDEFSSFTLVDQPFIPVGMTKEGVQA